jgi:hypothetical protein
MASASGAANAMPTVKTRSVGYEKRTSGKNTSRASGLLSQSRCPQ